MRLEEAWQNGTFRAQGDGAYLERIVELADAVELYRYPRHPHAQAILSAASVPDPARERTRERFVIQGEIGSREDAPVGCPFADRRPLVEQRCRIEPQQLLGEEHLVAWWKTDQLSCHYNVVFP